MAKLSVDQALLKAKSHARKGEIEEAQKLYNDVLQAFPKNKRAQQGLASLNKPKQPNPTQSSPQDKIKHLINLYNKGQLGAVVEQAKALTLQYPDAFIVWDILGAAAAQTGQIDQAINALKRVIAIKPDHVEAYNNLGNALKEQGKLDEAIASFQKAMSLKPNYVDAYNNMGIALKEQGKLDEAIASYTKALSLKPDDQEVHYNMGNALKEQRKLDEAIVSYKKALVLKPDYAKAYINLGNALQDQGKLDEAIACTNKALLLKPDYAEAHNNMGYILQDQGKLDEAITSYNKALALKPDYAGTRAQKLHLQAHICDWDEAKDDLTFLADLGIRKEDVPPFTLLALEDDPSRHRLRSENHANKKFSQNATINFVAPNQKPKRLRIGYFSADFHNHATMYLMAQVFTKHDKSNFEVLAFSYGVNTQDKMRQRLVNDVDAFHDVSDMSDLEIIDLARKERLDIAVDLKGYTEGNRLAPFAYGLAPVQISYLGYPGTLGTKFIDYIIADPIVIPEDKRQHYSEKIIYLPNAYQPTDNTRKISDQAIMRAELGLPDNGFIFCCFNNNYKISPKEFDIWMRLLSKVDGSVLWLFKSNRWAEQNLKREAERRGIVAERLIFAEKLPQAEHLARLKLADLFLDTFNYNAHTTASDALWAGLPLITKLGEGFAARVAGSLLSAIGLPELITNNETEYEKLALELATNPAKLASIKQKLAINRLSKPLFNTELYTKHLEDGYQRAYQQYFEGKKTSAIYVPE